MNVGDRVRLLVERDGFERGRIGVVFGFYRIEEDHMSVAVKFGDGTVVMEQDEVELIEAE